MILRLDPTVPVVWRSPTAVQLGVDPVVCVFDGASTAAERLLAALMVGAPESALPVIAESAGARPAFAAAFLDAVRPALLPAGSVTVAPPRSPASLRVAVDGAGPAASQFAAVLHGLGVRLADTIPRDGDELDAAVLFGSYALSPLRHGVWLRRDVPHLGVAFGERGVRLGPFVEPGIGPCLSCLDLARSDEDSAWPILASQLVTKRAPAEGGVFAASVTLRVARLLLDHLLGPSRELAGHFLELGMDGSERLTPCSPHERCGCRALPGTATAGVLQPDRFRFGSSSAAAAAAPA